MRPITLARISIMASLLALVGVFTLTGAASSRSKLPRRPAPMTPAITPSAPSLPTPSTVSPPLITANRQFGFKLFSQLREQAPDQNLFISPTSVATALSMAYNGANSTTQTAMATALQLNGLSLEDLNQAQASLRAALTNPEPEVQLTIANSLWAKSGITFKPDFLASNQAAYAAQITQLDFADPAAPDTINAWVKENTQGKIPTVIDRINPDQVMFLINAIYFKGQWAHQFDSALTTERPFYLLDGTSKQQPSMTQSDRYPYYETEQFQAVSLPYGSGRMSLYLFLPKANSSLGAFYQTLTAENWQTWTSRFSKQQGTIRLPKFKLEYGVDLKSALSALGMGVAFAASQADFSNLSDVPTHIDQVRHKTWVEVNESGTEAAAVTSIGMTATSAMPGLPFQMTIDRPFFFAIYDHQTATLLFMGSLVDPES
jgi:serine protease inhibitor